MVFGRGFRSTKRKSFSVWPCCQVARGRAVHQIERISTVGVVDEHFKTPLRRRDKGNSASDVHDQNTTGAGFCGQRGKCGYGSQNRESLPLVSLVHRALQAREISKARHFWSTSYPVVGVVSQEKGINKALLKLVRGEVWNERVITMRVSD